MPLIKYSGYIFLPGGNPAANMPFAIKLVGGNRLIPLLADKQGNAPLPNPLMTDADGLLMFYAAPGAFCVELSGEMFQIMPAADETDEAWPGTFVYDQASPLSVWTIDHFFGIQPSVAIVVDGTESEAQVSHVDTITTVITFSQPVSGQAYLRR